MTPRVSVVIPVYGRTALLRKAIVSLFAQDLGEGQLEIIVVDSSPDDANERLVHGLADAAPFPLRFFRKSPEGPGPSRNLGAGEAKADFIAFMDSDCQAHPQMLRHSLAAFEPGVGIVQGKTLPDPEGRLGALTWYPMNEKEYFVYECTNIVYRRVAFETAGGFPPDATPLARRGLGGEDVTLAWTVRQNGWQTRFAAESIVYHEVVQVSFWEWIYQRRLILWPGLVRRFPELRGFLPARYFFDRAQLYLVLGIAGALLSPVSAWALVLTLPYALLRGSPRSRNFPGPLRPLRILPFLARDGMSLAILVVGSLRHRSLLL
jgi:glycosyltransferase involved in cell wall biosynthesis